MLNNFTYYLIFGKPLIMYLGIITFLSLLTTAYIGYSIYTGKKQYPISYHFWMAKTTIALALFHGILGILAFF